MSAVGIVLFVGTITDMLGSPWSLIPAFLIVIGIVMLADTIRSPAREHPIGGKRPN